MYNGKEAPRQLTNFTAENTYIGDVTELKSSVFFVANGSAGRELYRLTPVFTSISATTDINDITIYPNPTKDLMYVRLDLKASQTLSVTLTDIQGRIVYETKPILYSASKHDIKINIGHISTGHYVFNVFNNNGLISSGKVIKK